MNTIYTGIKIVEKQTRMRVKSLDSLRAKKNIKKIKKMSQTVQFLIINPRQ